MTCRREQQYTTNNIRVMIIKIKYNVGIYSGRRESFGRIVARKLNAVSVRFCETVEKHNIIVPVFFPCRSSLPYPCNIYLPNR